MIAGIVLAAGRSRRMGRAKALLAYGGGTFLSRAVAALRGGGCGQVIVVTGPPEQADAEAVAREAARLGARVAVNPRSGSEQIDSLRVGIRAAGSARAVVVLPVDAPAVDAAAVRGVVEAFLARDAPVVRAAHGGRGGHPVLFARRLFAELLDPDLPQGARTVVHRHAAWAESVESDSPGVLADVDTPADYRLLLDAGDARENGDDGDAAAERDPGSGGAGAALPLDAAEAVRIAHAALAGGEPAASVVVVAAEPGSGAAPGARMAVFAGRSAGTLGDAELDRAAAALARQVLAGDAGAGVREIALPAGAASVFVEAHRVRAELVIVGAGHIARPLCRIGAMLGFRVTVLDDRPEFATRERFPEAERVARADFSAPLRGVEMGPGTWLVLATRGHKYDFEALRDALRRPRPPAYVGMVSSRRRTRAALEQLLADGVAPERLRLVHAPIGLDVGAETPEEIAVSIAAELVLARRGGTGQPLADRARVVERTLAKLEYGVPAGTVPAGPSPQPKQP